MLVLGGMEGVKRVRVKGRGRVKRGKG